MNGTINPMKNAATVGSTNNGNALLTVLFICLVSLSDKNRADGVYTGHPPGHATEFLKRRLNPVYL